MHPEYQYLNLLQDVLENGSIRNDRTGVGTLSVFGRSMRFNMSDGFPLITTKKVFWRGIAEELLWFLRGETNVKSLQDKGVTIWDEWADTDGNVGPIYGNQWTSCTKYKYMTEEYGFQNTFFFEHDKPINQIQNVINELKKNPDSRRLIVSAWNVAELDKMALMPCHYAFQLYSRVFDGKRYLNLMWQQRSMDLFLGCPFNIASYALLLSMISQITNHIPDELIANIGDAHIYSNHVEQVREQLTRVPYELPTLELNKNVTDIFQFKYEDIKLINYQCHPAIKAPIAV